MAPLEVKKRKACDACTKAKAKCSPSQYRAEVCERCERLGKECVYGESMRKRGPRTRSRMKQLEQRVEALMGILSATGAAPELLSKLNSSASALPLTNSPDSTRSDDSPPPCDTPGVSSAEAFADPFTTDPVEPGDLTEAFITYDPVNTGLLEDDQVIQFLDEFRRDHTNCFPFVVVDPSLDADTIRREQPFLFLSIMATMSYRTPSIQRTLGEAFRQQVAVRIVGSSHKGLEMLQGLLVHSAYYHYHYHPGQQQLALMIQMCVALAQELGLSKKTKSRNFSDAPLVLSKAEDRALLGTFYLAAAFAQAWRTRTTVPHTRAIARACQSFSQQPEYVSDLIISPLIQSSDLVCRISDYFSYDDIEGSEINGETILKLSTNNFSAEIRRLRDAVPEPVRDNNTIRLSCDMLDVMVYECSIHSTLWRPSPQDTSSIMTNARISMLQHSLLASQAFARTLLAASTSSLNSLTFSVWSGWFYSTLLVMKIVILQQIGDTSSTRVNSVPHTVGDLLPQDHGGSTTRKISKMTLSLEHASLRDSITTLEEIELVSLLESFIQKLEAADPQHIGADRPDNTKPFLLKVATLQSALLAGTKKMACPNPDISHAQQTEPGLSTSDGPVKSPLGYHVQQSLQGQYPDPGSMDHQPSFDFAYLDNATAFGLQPGQQPPVDDWLWNMVMNDGNMFTI